MRMNHPYVYHSSYGSIGYYAVNRAISKFESLSTTP